MPNMTDLKGTLEMLPKFTNYIVASVAAVALTATTVAPAQAFDRDERQFLKGVAAALIVGTIIKETKKNKNVTPQPQPQPTPVVIPSSIYQTPTAVAFQSYTPAQRRLIQQRLAAYGYYRSGIDGAFGPGTYNAITIYARDIGKTSAMSTTAGAYGVLDGLIYG